MRKRAGDGIRHVHTVGRTRVGKSFVLLSWFLNALARGMGVGLIDPHGDLFYRVLFHLARAAFYRPELYERVVIINPVHKNWCVGFNPLELWPGEVAERK